MGCCCRSYSEEDKTEFARWYPTSAPARYKHIWPSRQLDSVMIIYEPVGGISFGIQSCGLIKIAYARAGELDSTLQMNYNSTEMTLTH